LTNRKNVGWKNDDGKMMKETISMNNISNGKEGELFSEYDDQ
jgi:hypothetical protein